MIVEATVNASDTIFTTDELDLNRFFRDRAYVLPCSILATRSSASSDGLSPGRGIADWIGEAHPSRLGGSLRSRRVAAQPNIRVAPNASCLAARWLMQPLWSLARRRRARAALQQVLVTLRNVRRLALSDETVPSGGWSVLDATLMTPPDCVLFTQYTIDCEWHGSDVSQIAPACSK